MHAYDGLLALAGMRTVLGAAAWIKPPDAASRPYAATAQGTAEICCALMMRAWFDLPFRAQLGGWIYPAFLFALIWSIVVWFEWILPLVFDWEPVEQEPTTRFDAARLAFGESGYRVVGVFWHALFVAPALFMGLFIVTGLAGELGH